MRPKLDILISHNFDGKNSEQNYSLQLHYEWNFNIAGEILKTWVLQTRDLNEASTWEIEQVQFS